MHTKENEYRVDTADDADSQPAQILLNPYQCTGQCVTSDSTGRADNPQSDRCADEHDQHGIEEGFGDCRGNAVNCLFYLGQYPSHNDGRENGIGIVCSGYRDAKERYRVTGRKQGLQGGMNENACDGDAQEQVCLEVAGSRCGDQNGQEVERAIADDGQYLIGHALTRQHTQHGQQDEQNLHHGTANDRRDNWGHGAQQGIHHGSRNAFFLLFGFGRGRLIQNAEFLHCLKDTGNAIANDDLILAAGMYDADDAGNFGYCVVIGQTFIGQGQSQTSGTICRTADVGLAAHPLGDQFCCFFPIHERFNLSALKTEELFVFLSKNQTSARLRSVFLSGLGDACDVHGQVEFFFLAQLLTSGLSDVSRDFLRTGVGFGVFAADGVQQLAVVILVIGAQHQALSEKFDVCQKTVVGHRGRIEIHLEVLVHQITDGVNQLGYFIHLSNFDAGFGVDKMQRHKCGLVLGKGNRQGFPNDLRGLQADSVLIRVIALDLPAHGIANHQAILIALDSRINMIGNGDVNALIQLFSELILGHLDDFFAENHVIHRNPGDEFLKAAGVLL